MSTLQGAVHFFVIYYSSTDIIKILRFEDKKKLHAIANKKI